MKDFKGGMRFIGSNNAKISGIHGPTASGVIVDKLPPDQWDVPKDPEWIVRFDPQCGGGTKCVRESILRRFKLSMN